MNTYYVEVFPSKEGWRYALKMKLTSPDTIFISRPFPAKEQALEYAHHKEDFRCTDFRVME